MGQAYYGYSSDPEEGNLIKLTKNLGKFSEDSKIRKAITFNQQCVDDNHHVVINPETVCKSERVDLLRKINELTRSQGSSINQVRANMAEKKRKHSDKL